MASHFATDHHRIRVPTDRVLSAIGPTVAAMSEPMVSHDVVAFYLLSQEVSQHVKVVQSGQGADEVFAGYHWYQKLAGASGEGVDEYAGVFFDRDHAAVAEVVNGPDCVIIEANEQPGLANHEPQPTVERFIDLLFPA